MKYNILIKSALAMDTGIDITANKAGLSTKSDISGITGSVLAVILGFLGTLFLILIVVGGIMWMTSAGNDEQVKKAKSLIIAAFLGILIIFLSYAFTQLIGRIIGGI